MRKKAQYVVSITAEAVGPSQPQKGSRLEVKELAGRPAHVFLNGRITAVGEVRMGRGAISVWLTDVSRNVSPASRKR